MSVNRSVLVYVSLVLMLLPLSACDNPLATSPDSVSGPSSTPTPSPSSVPIGVSVNSVSLNHSTLSMSNGGTETLAATVLPANATNKNLTWSSSNTSVATVSSGGVVNAVHSGTATITVTTTSGGHTASCAVTVVNAGVAQWAATVSSGSASSLFNDVTKDDSGNTYAVGFITGTSAYGFGNSVSVTSGFSGGNAVIVKYDSSGAAQWASTVSPGAGESQFKGVTTDGSGNIYAVGYVTGAAGGGSYGFGNGVTVTSLSGSTSIVIVKYNSSGVAQWASALSSGTGGNLFKDVTTDISGNIYAVGFVMGSPTGATYGFGNGVTVTSGAGGSTTLIVKYNGAGLAQWASTPSSASSFSSFAGVAADGSGYIYAVGAMNGSAAYGFGNGVVVTGVSSTFNPLIVRYNSSGFAQSASTISSGAGGGIFNGVAIDNLGNAYAAGVVYGPGAHDFGNGVTVTSAATAATIVKYNNSGLAQWASGVSSGAPSNQFTGVTIDDSGNTYVAGIVYGTGAYVFGNGVTATGVSAGTNSVIVKYNGAGLAQWASTTSSGSSVSQFTGVAIDSSGNTYAVGSIDGGSSHGFGNNVTVAGASAMDDNVLIVKYN